MQGLIGRLDPNELLEAAYSEIALVIPSDTFVVTLFDSTTNELTNRLHVSMGEHKPGERRALTPGIIASVIADKHPVLIQDS